MNKTRIFVYEFLTGGGLLATKGALPASLLQEGNAMLSALAADFSADAGVQVDLLCEPRTNGLQLPGCRVHRVETIEEERTAFQSLAAAADWTVVIAPEIDGALLDRCQLVIAAGGRLLGPGPDLVALCADKQATAEHLQAAGVPAPDGIALSPGDRLPVDFPFPAVLKPCDGAGSVDVRFIASHSSDLNDGISGRRFRLERFCPGLPASVAWLCGPCGNVPLIPCRQHLSDDGRFQYLGGSLPLMPPLAHRAIELSRRAIDSLAPAPESSSLIAPRSIVLIAERSTTLRQVPGRRSIPGPLGYIGVDLALGNEADGSADKVIEINPRLTTSYVGLRGAAKCNLARAMLQIAEGSVASVSFQDITLEFRPNGQVGRLNPCDTR